MQYQRTVADHGVQVFVEEADAKQSGALRVLWNVIFGHVLPVRSLGSFQGLRVSRGWWWFAAAGEGVDRSSD